MEHHSIILKELVENTHNKRVQERSQKRTRVLGIKTRKNFRRFVFLVKSYESYSSPKGHFVSLLYPKLDLKTWSNDRRITPMNQRVRVYCSCPAWQYWGSAYWSDNMKYYIPPHREDRYPEIRDPEGNNLVCKHALRVAYYVRKKGFEYLMTRFRQKSFQVASLQEDVIPALVESLTRIAKLSYSDAEEIACEATEDNLEDLLEEHGLILPTIQGEIDDSN